MKTTVFSLFLLVILSFVGCSKDDNEENDNGNAFKNQIVGTWNVVEFTSDGKTENVTDGDINLVVYQNNTYSVKYYEESHTGAYTLSGTTLNGVTNDSEPMKESFNFTNITGNTAMINYSNSDGMTAVIKAEKK